ncbi:hypothetical protein LJC49_04500 [Ruminococcaceae bacterium OttesenSCG-928-I18]|nr:hypothetical protein [Ruminococcaceae bacterium OttesenSCG-928-I18]
MRPFANHFDRLIDKYSVTFAFLAATSGGYDAGKYVPGEPDRKELRGAIIPLPERKVYQPGGSFTEKDRNLILKRPLPAPLEDAKVEYKGNVYSVEEETDHSDYGNVAVYVLRWVSNLSKKRGVAP